MTDKVQKIREEVARIQLYTQSEVLKQVLDYIDKVQEEPVCNDLKQKAKEIATMWKAYGVPYNAIYEAVMEMANWQKHQIITKIANHQKLEEMVNKFEAKYKPEKILDSEYYKCGIFDTLRVIKEDRL